MFFSVNQEAVIKNCIVGVTSAYAKCYLILAELEPLSIESDENMFPVPQVCHADLMAMCK